MAFTYKVDQLKQSPLFQVRFRLGDTDMDTASFQDEEIQFALDSNNNDITRACIDCVSALLPRLAQQTEFTVGPYTERSSATSYNYWLKVLDELKAKVSGYGAPIMMSPTGPSIFHYGMLGVDDHAENT